MSDKSEILTCNKKVVESKTKNHFDKSRDPKHMKKRRKKSHSNSAERTPSCSNPQRSPKVQRSPRRNIAQNRLKKLRAKLDAEIKIKEKVENLGIERLVDESVVKIERRTAQQNKLKPHKIPKYEAQVSSSGSRNLAAGRLTKLKKELQETIVAKESEMMMDVDMDIDETNDESLIKGDCSVICPNKATPISENSPLNSRLHSVGPKFSFSDCDVACFVEEISKIREEPSYQALHTNFAPDVDMNLAFPFGDLFIVVDTNIFLSHLKFIEYLSENSLPPFNSHVLVVPWPVIQEIDYAMKKPNAALALKARYANSFINTCVKTKNPRFFAQTLNDFKENFKNAVNIDDFILQYCMKFASFDHNVVLLTNDRNLCTKAMINQLKVYTKEEFQKTYNISNYY